VNYLSHTVVENIKQFAFKGDKSRVVRRTFWLIKVVPTWKKFGKHCSMLIGELHVAVRLHDCRDGNLFHTFYNSVVLPMCFPLPHCHAPANKSTSLLQCQQLIYCQHVRPGLFLWLYSCFKYISFSTFLITSFCLKQTTSWQRRIEGAVMDGRPIACLACR
jgi:hypothetical protein